MKISLPPNYIKKRAAFAAIAFALNSCNSVLAQKALNRPSNWLDSDSPPAFSQSSDRRAAEYQQALTGRTNPAQYGNSLNTLPVRTGRSKILFDSYTEQAKEALKLQSFVEASKLYQLALEQTGGWPADDHRTLETMNSLLNLYTYLNQQDRVAALKQQLRSIGQCMYRDPNKFLPLAKSRGIEEITYELARADELVEKGHFDEAEGIYLDLYSATNGVEGDIEAFKARLVDRLARLNVKNGKSTKAETLLSAQLKEAESKLEVNPENADKQLAMASILSALSYVQRKKGALEAAQALCLKAMSYTDQTSGKYSQQKYLLLNDIGLIHLGMNRPTYAIRDFKQAIEISQHRDSKLSNLQIRKGLLNLAKAFEANGQTKDAEINERKAERLAPASSKPNPNWITDDD